jgi:hypothetical protein
VSTPNLYRGLWPQNVSKLAKYALRFLDGTWKISVLYEAGEGLRYLAVDGEGAGLIQRINAVKTALRDQPGGAFYVNEFRHVLVPVADSSGSGFGSHYYSAGRLGADLTFEFEGAPLSTKPVRPDGSSLVLGDHWPGPRPGIPYVLAAGGGDIYYESPALTDTDPPSVRPSMTRKVQLSRVLGDKSAVSRSVRAVANVRGHQGGRFYVNEHGAMFTPVGASDGNGLDYIYCGQIERAAWFPEPLIEG